MHQLRHVKYEHALMSAKNQGGFLWNRQWKVRYRSESRNWSYLMGHTGGAHRCSCLAPEVCFREELRARVSPPLQMDCTYPILWKDFLSAGEAQQVNSPDNCWIAFVCAPCCSMTAAQEFSFISGQVQDKDLAVQAQPALQLLTWSTKTTACRVGCVCSVLINGCRRLLMASSCRRFHCGFRLCKRLCSASDASAQTRGVEPDWHGKAFWKGVAVSA